MTTVHFIRHARPDLSVHDDHTRPLLAVWPMHAGWPFSLLKISASAGFPMYGSRIFPVLPGGSGPTATTSCPAVNLSVKRKPAASVHWKASCNNTPVRASLSASTAPRSAASCTTSSRRSAIMISARSAMKCRGLSRWPSKTLRASVSRSTAFSPARPAGFCNGSA